MSLIELYGIRITLAFIKEHINFHPKIFKDNLAIDHWIYFTNYLKYNETDILNENGFILDSWVISEVDGKM